MSVYTKLAEVQSKLRVSKEQFNSFGKYKYRSCEDILEAVKPILEMAGALIMLSDSVEFVGDRFYIKASASFVDTQDGQAMSVSAYAREDLDKKGMDPAQITGSASSYARKYALNGLLCIDDTKDSDATNKRDNKDPAEEPEKSKQLVEPHDVEVDEYVSFADKSQKKYISKAQANILIKLVNEKWGSNAPALFIQHTGCASPVYVPEDKFEETKKIIDAALAH